MLGIHDLALFVVSGLLLNMMPGPDSLLIMLRSGSQGWRAGSVAALGIGTGTMVHVLAAALGLSALLSASAAVRRDHADGGALSGLSGDFPAQARRKLICCERARSVAASALLWADLSAGPADQFTQPQGRALLPRLCTSVYRPRCAAEGAGVYRAGLHLQH